MFITLLLLSTTTIGFSQNTFNSVVVQQQTIQSSNVSNDNNIGNYNVNPSILNNRGNVNKPSTARVQQVRSRGSRGNRSNASNVYKQVDQNDNVGNDNLVANSDNSNPSQSKEFEQTDIEVPQINLNLNLNFSVPTINLNKTKVKEEKVKEEKVAPKRLDDFRIKTGSNSSSGSISHKSKKEKKSFQKKIVKPIKCWMQRTFKHNAKFHFSCECFKF